MKVRHIARRRPARKTALIGLPFGLCLLVASMAWAEIKPDPSPVCDPTQSSRPLASSALNGSGAFDFEKFLSLGKKEITADLLQQTFCEAPEEFCETVRELTPAQFGVAFSTQEEGAVAIPKGFAMIRALETPEGTEAVLDALQEQAGPDQSALMPLYSGASWQRLQDLNSSAIQTLVEHLSNPALSIPAPVIEKIAQLKLVNPFDESLPLEKRKELFANCGLTDGWDRPHGDTLGAFNAFANVEGFVVVCPKTLMAENDEGLLTILLHEISHQIGPCLVGGSILTQVTTPNCEVDTRLQPELTPWLDWMGRTRKLERCFHNSGINAGSESEWLGRFLSQEVAREEKSTGKHSCESNAARHLLPSDRVQEGLISTCDTSQYKLLIQIMSAMDGVPEDEGSVSKTSRVRKLARTTQLKLRSIQAKVRDSLPDTNQFNEAFSDVFASRLLEQSLQNFQKERGEAKRPIDPNAILSGFSGLCTLEYNWKLKGEAHSRDDRRMAILASQTELRKALGCTNNLGPGLSRRLSRCEGMGL